MTPLFTLGSGWVEQYLSSMVLLNFLLGHPTAGTALRAPDIESLPHILNEIAQGKYEPGRYFQSGGPARRSFVVRPPDLLPGEMYTVLVLNGSTPTSDFVSVETGGIIFEDPAWAVFAAHALTQQPKRGVPLALDTPDLWKRIAVLSTAIHDGKYSPSAFFGPVTGFIGASSAPAFQLMEITGEKLAALRSRGMQSFGSPTPKFYMMFQTTKQ
ncbi:MAG: hypothetical protein JWP63_2716 [Candidatus Solibacter sp.]|nr:hypothetical protein [Candidatus Solibacter sp.]